MSEKGLTPSRSKDTHERAGAKPSSIPVTCGMEDCDHGSHLRFLGDSPFDGFKFETEGWTVVEDTEEHRTVFLCTDCAKEFEQEIAGEEEGDEELDDEPEAP